MDNSQNSNQTNDIVKLKQMLKKWKKQANLSSNDRTNNNDNVNNTSKKGSLSRSNSNDTPKKGSLSRTNSFKGITFLKRTLSFNDISTSTNAVPKGFLAVQVGEEKKRFVIPTNYLSHQAFSVLLKEAEDEFGFQQEGVLRIPCEVEVFENIIKLVEAKAEDNTSPQLKEFGIVCGSLESQSLSQSHHPPSPMCR